MKSIAVLLALATAALAADLPDAPVPPERKQPVYDRQLWLATGTHFAVRVADDARTCRNLASGGHEVVFPTQSCAGVVALNSATFAAAAFTSYELAKHHHRKLGLAVQYVATALDAGAVVYSYTARTHHPCRPNWPCN